MGLNLASVCSFVQANGKDKLDGLFLAVHTKCQELGINPGRRDNVPGGDVGNVNIRSVLSFVESVQPITDEDKTPQAGPHGEVLDESDQASVNDALDVLSEKARKRQIKAERASQRLSRLAAKSQDHEALRKLYGTLKARYASAGYKPPFEAAAESPAE